MADCTRASHTLGMGRSTSGKDTENWSEDIRGICSCSTFHIRAHAKQETLGGYGTESSCYYGHILILILAEHKTSLCKSSPLLGNRESPGCSTEWNDMRKPIPSPSVCWMRLDPVGSIGNPSLAPSISIQRQFEVFTHVHTVGPWAGCIWQVVAQGGDSCARQLFFVPAKTCHAQAEGVLFSSTQAFRDQNC